VTFSLAADRHQRGDLHTAGRRVRQARKEMEA
jgi:hypothetical protein